MTYEDWRKNSKAILKKAEEYDKWRRETQHRLLTEIGPRIAAIGEKGYMGCGFHYEKERIFGNLIKTLSIPWQPSANHCEKIEDDRAGCIINKVIFNDLIEQIEEAEK